MSAGSQSGLGHMNHWWSSLTRRRDSRVDNTHHGIRSVAALASIAVVLALTAGPLVTLANAEGSDSSIPNEQADTPPAPPEVTEPAGPPTPGDAPADEATPPADDANNTTTGTTAPAETDANLDGTPAPDAFPGLPALPDEDGVSADIENGAPNGGDGNGDGIQDSEQANVASLPSKYDVNGDGSLNDYITIESPDGTSLANAKTLTVPTDNPPPDGAEIPAGLIDYDVHVAAPGDKADVKLYLPGGEQSSVYMLQEGNWKNFSSRSDINDNADEVVLKLADGGAGDQSGTDGVIHDPVGVAAAAPQGSFTVRNDMVPESGAPNVTYTLQSCGTGGSPTGCAGFAPAKTANLADNGTNTFTGIPTTNNLWVRVVATAPAGWSVSSISCTGGSTQQTDVAGGTGSVRTNAGASGGGACSFVLAQDGTVTVIKQTNTEGAAQTFGVHLQRCGSGNNDTACGGGNPFVTPNNVTIADNGQQTWTAANITTAGGFGGRFELTEDLNGWTLSSVSCTGGNGFSLKSQLTNGQRFFATSATPGIVCTFNNTAPPPASGTITVHKGSTRAAGGNTGLSYANGLQNAVFEYSADGNTWTDLCTTNASGDCTSAVVQPGTYTVREKTAPAPYSTIPSLVYGGNSAGTGNATHAYVGTVTVGNSGTFEPTVEINNSGTTNTPHRFINTRANPTYPNQCGITISLILDRSGSITANRASYIAAGQALINSLAGTPTSVNIFSFAASANTDQLAFLPLNVPANVTSLNNTIASVFNSSSGNTNWDAGMMQAYNSANTGQISIILTDGNPTTWDGSPQGGGGTILLNDLEAGIAAANSLKSESKIIAVGSGSGITASNLNLISSVADTYTSSIADLTNTLQGLANQFCGARVHVKKLVNGQPANGWTFTGATPTAGVTVAYNNNTQVTGAGGNPAGEMQVNLNNVPSPNGAQPVTVTETAQGGFSFVNGDCRTGSFAGPNAAGSSVVNGVASIPQVLQQQDYYCTFNNVQNPGNIIIKKTGIGSGPGAGFVFSGSGTPFGANGLTLTTQTGGSTETSQTYVVPANTGTGYTVSENAAPAGWDFTSLSCTNPDGTDPSVVNGQSVAIKVSAGETVTCTWTNTKRGNVIIKKTGVGAGPGAPFVFSGSGTPFGANGLTLTTQTGGSTETSQTYSVAPNTVTGYTVSENAPPAGWGFTTLVCDNPNGSDPSVITGQQAAIKVSAGETVTCTWTNTKTNGQIIVKKTGIGAGAGAGFLFSGGGTPFGANGLTLTTQTGGSTETSQTYSVPVNTGTGYTVTENAPPAGWDFTNVVCDDGDSTLNQGARSATIKVSSGETVTCTWTNTKRANIIVKKTGVGAGPGGAFDFSGSGTPFGASGLTLNTPAGGGTATSSTYSVAPNTGSGYTVTENAPPSGWAFTGVVCDDGDSTTDPNTRGATYKVSAGETVTCTWTNSKSNGQIIVKKTGIGAGAGAGFLFSGSGTPFGANGLTLTTQSGGSTETSQTYTVPVNTGTGYAVSENDPSGLGWDFTGVVCDDGDSTTNPGARSATFKVGAGETVTCTWTNTKRANIIVKKTGVGAGAGGAFDFSGSGTPFGANGLTLNTPAAGGTATSTTYSVAPNTVAGYTVSENAPPAGWGFTSLSCDDGDSTTNPGARSATYKVSAGETVTCTWINTKTNGQIIIKKTGIGAGAGAGFLFSGSGTPFGANGLTLTTQTGGSTETSQTYSVPVNTATGYTVSENDPAGLGWDFTSVACDDGDSTLNQGARSATIKVSPGETVTCTYTNTKKASIIVKKTGVGAGPGGAFDFSGSGTPFGANGLTLNTPAAGGTATSTTYSVTPNTVAGYTVSENAPPAGWNFTSVTCDDGDSTTNPGARSATYKVGPGEVVTCTWTNTKKASIIVKKTGVGAGAGGAFDFSGSGTPFGANGLTLNTPAAGGTATSQTYSVDPNTGAGYTVSENAPPAGWDFTSVSCDDGDSTTNPGARSATYKVGPGEVVTCTWINTKRANVIIKKTGVGSGPGAAFNFPVPASFGEGGNTLTLNTPSGGGSDSKSYSVLPNTAQNPYVVNESTPPTGWDFTNLACDNASSTDQPTRTASIVAGPGETVTCTWTNTKHGKVIIKKTGVGAGAGGSFDFSGAGTPFGPNGLNLQTPTDGGTVASQTYDVVPNSTNNPYVVTENAPVAPWSFTNVVCDNTPSSTDQIARKANIVVAPGETVTCTWTNTKGSSVTVVKEGVGLGAGGAFDFPVPASFGEGGNTLTLNTPNGGGSVSKTYQVSPNTAQNPYLVNENNPPAGWDFTNLACTGGGSTDQPTRTASIVVGPGQNVTCTWTNTKRGKVVVKKTGVGSGPGASFDFSGTGTPFGPSGLTLNTPAGGGTATSTTYDVAPNSALNPYVVSENAPPAGWDFTNVVCDDNSGTNQGARSASIVVSPGETVTCTWTNTKRGNVIIKKTGVGAGAGGAFDFSGTGTPFGPSGLTLNTPADGGTATSQTYSVAPNTVQNPYGVSENAPPAGWDFTSVVCDNTPSSTDQNARSASIVVSPGETVTCTWTNTKRAKVIVKKTGVGAGAGGAFDFSGTGTPFGPSGLTLNTPAGGGSDASTSYDVVPNTGSGYTVTENAPPSGWDFSSVACDDVDSTTNQNTRGATFKVGPGETVTCTWTNTKRAKVIVKKTGVGAGAGGAFDFSGTGTPFGPSGLTLNTPAGGGTATSTTYEVTPNTVQNPYVVSEDAPPSGWAFTNLVCDNTSSTDQNARSASIVVGPGETVTCTWTNTKGANIIVKKTGVGAGAGGAFDFSGTGTPFGPSGLTLNTPAAGGTATSSTYPAAPNTAENPYVVSENAPPAGWDFTNVVCDDDSGTNQGARSASIVVGPGETVTCTWTNTKRGNVIIKKAGVGAGAGGAFDFSGAGTPFGANGLTLNTPADGGTATSTTYSVAPNTADNAYVVSENAPPAGWDFTSVACDDTSSTDQGARSASIVVSPGETVTCTWTNTKRGNIVVTKQTTPDGDPTSFAFAASYGQFSLKDGESNDSGLLKPGNYDVSETTPDGWTLSSATCSDGSPVGAIVLNPGETVTCTFNNTLNTASITVVKHIGASSTTDAAGWDIAGSVSDAQTGRFTDPNVTNGGLNAEGTTTGSDPSLTFSLDHVANAGTTVTLLETLQEGFSFGGFSCNGEGAVNIQPHSDPDTDRGGTVLVGKGENIVCTFVNDPSGIGLTKTASQPTLNPGQQFTYTLTAKNTADVPLHDVTFTDTLDAALTFVSSADGCSAVGQLVTCGPYYESPDPEFLPGETKTVTFVVQVGANVPVGTVIPNTGEVSAKPVDGPPVTATAPATVDVIEVSPEVVVVPDIGIGTGTLPFTGSDTSMLLKSAIWLLALGGGLVLFARRRRRRAAQA